ncbi:MAG: SH3 domain-containing protein [Myxococcaceae bacterium]
MLTSPKWSLIALAAMLVGCSGTSALDVQSETLIGADEDQGDLGLALSTSVNTGATLSATANVNLRTGPSTGRSILHVVPRGAAVVAVNGTPSSGWYNVKHNGVSGWCYGAYLKLVSAGEGPSPAPSGAREAAIARARSGVGFSYWWGHGRWQPGALTSQTRGYCSGSCPSCTHSGGNGADCSGYLAKVWQVPSSNDTLSDDSHPYSTWNFDNSSVSWTTVSRSSLRSADALVYNTNGAGHIFLYESGDGWGSLWAYEAKGCASGIVHNLRTASSAYKALARNGY